MKPIHTLAILLLCAFLPGCTKSDEQKIVGSWLAEEGPRIEFFEDGTATFQDTKKTGLAGMQSAGTWTKLSDGRFKLTLTAMGTSTVTTFKASFPDKSSIVIAFDNADTEAVTMKRQ